ncbi:SRPBCC domain-containing protein [Ferrovibrio sp.]|uniref:SRPBCC family protein n=1 Tax=Ferrovibrio sp. TaxID=1917215 RepID=UPI00311E95C3
MTDIAVKPQRTQTQATQTQAIVIEAMFRHPPQTLWRALTTGTLIARWMMEPAGFAAVVGNRFTFRTTPAGAWDGVIHCEVLDVVPNERLSYAWRGGDDGNAGYGSKLDTVVTFTLQPAGSGTRLRLEHAGFELPKNDTAYQNMGKGWKKVVENIGTVVDEPR